ncbi:MAG: hypothetical protein ABI923_05125 [bacterium]
MQSRDRWNRLFVGIAAPLLLICAGPLRASADLNAGAYGDDYLTPKDEDRSALTSRAHEDELRLTDEDRAEIVSQMLKREVARIKEERSKYERPRKGNLTLTLSTQNIKPSLVPDIPRVKFFLTEPEEIQKRIKEARGISYLAFDKFEVKGSLVSVSLSNVDRGAGRIRQFIYIKTNEYEYRKEGGKWAGKLVKSGGLIT